MIDPANGKKLESVNISLGGRIVTGAQSLAANPQSGKLFAILVLDFAAFQNGKRALVTLNPETGKATLIGTVQSSSSALRSVGALAFDQSGKLYGATSAMPAGGNANKLFSINPETGAMNSVATLTNSTKGSALAFNPDDGKLYHVSGSSVFEKINLPDFGKTNGSLSGQATGFSRALTSDLVETLDSERGPALARGARPIAGRGA